MKVLSNLRVSRVAPSFESVDIAPPRRPRRPLLAPARVALHPPAREALKAVLLFLQSRTREGSIRQGR